MFLPSVQQPESDAGATACLHGDILSRKNKTLSSIYSQTEFRCIIMQNKVYFKHSYCMLNIINTLTGKQYSFPMYTCNRESLQGQNLDQSLQLIFATLMSLPWFYAFYIQRIMFKGKHLPDFKA